LFSSSADKTIKIFQYLEKKQEMYLTQSLKGHRAQVRSLAFIEDQ